MKSIYILILCLLVSFTGIAKTTYYIDATNGHDNNNGKTPFSSWKTIYRVNQQHFSQGDRILFKRGEIWSGTRLYITNVVGTASKNIVYGAYGTGAKPILSSVIPHAHNWTYTANNIWKATNPPAKNPNRLLINGTEKLRANIHSELDGSNYHWRYDGITNDLYIYSVINPSSFTIEYSDDFPIIVGWSKHITIQDLDIQGGWTGIFITTLSKQIHLINLKIGKYCREGIIISSGSNISTNYPTNILIENCRFDTFFNFNYSTAGIYSGNSDRGCNDGFRANALNTGTLKNCYFKNWGHSSISLQGVKVSNVSVHDNYLTSPNICYGGRLNVDDATHNEVFNNQIINTSIQSQLNGQFNHYHHNTFSGTTNSPLRTDITACIELQGYANSNVKDNIYENNLFINNAGPGFRISGNNNYDIHNNSIRNNIFFNCGTLNNGQSIVVKQNLYHATYNNSFQNNLIFNTSTTQTCNFRETLYDVSNFNIQSATDGYILTDNIAEHPQFVDLNNKDYHLSANSPCIDAGTVTLATLDFDGNAIPSSETNPDIGLYEFQSNQNNGGATWNDKIVVFPNPTSGIFTVKTSGEIIIEIEIHNILGELIYKTALANQQTTIDFSKHSKGIYFIKITDSTRNKTNKKIILK